VTTCRRCAVRARRESAVRALSRTVVSGTATCCAAAHTGAAMQAHTYSCRNMVSTSLEFGGVGVSRPPACAVRTRQSSAASEDRWAEWRRETKRGLTTGADGFLRLLDHRGDMYIRRDEHDTGLSRPRTDRARAHAVVAARVLRRGRAAVIRARPLVRRHRHAAPMRHAGHRVRRHHRWTRRDRRDGKHHGERTTQGGDDRSSHRG
jgi:hypothetical protein